MARLHSGSGFVSLISVLIIGAVGAAVVASLLVMSLGSSRTSFTLEQSNEAKALADACVEEGLKQVRSSVAFTGSSNLALGQGTCSYTVTSEGGQNRTITAAGISGAVTRKVRVKLSSVTPNLTIGSWQEVADF